MEKLTVYKFKSRDELCKINIWEPKINACEGEWANQLIGHAESLGSEINAPDYDETTCGDENGINVLIPKIDLAIWVKACQFFGSHFELACWDQGVELGTYGDDDHFLFEDENGTGCFWLPPVSKVAARAN